MMFFVCGLFIVIFIVSYIQIYRYYTDRHIMMPKKNKEDSVNHAINKAIQKIYIGESITNNEYQLLCKHFGTTDIKKWKV